MKFSLASWTKFINELRAKKWDDYNANIGQWYDVPVEDIRTAAQAAGGQITIASELYDLIATAYSKIGGHTKLRKPSDLPSKYDGWSAIELDGDPEPDALRVATSKGLGSKFVAAGHDGSRPAINAYIKRTADLLKEDGYYGELSKAIAHIMITRHNVPYTASHKDVENVLGKKVKWLGAHPDGKYPGYDGWYVREIAGNAELKILVGRPRGINSVTQP
tara:strand:- start:10191 stop:10847 length:657 start_codon:yes stop_codon:yes gene_type:complete